MPSACYVPFGSVCHFGKVIEDELVGVFFAKRIQIEAISVAVTDCDFGGVVLGCHDMNATFRVFRITGGVEFHEFMD